MRYFMVFFGAIAVIALASIPAPAQTGFDRRGGDYTSFPIRSGDPVSCASRCERDQKCKAWSFSYPRMAHAAATCWLKNQVPPRVADKCCVSGVRGAGVIEPRLGHVEYSIDRAGGDYRNFETPAEASGSACKVACESDNRCRAWTYRRPGYGTAAARCYLKNRIKRPRRAPCCISGVVR